VALVFEMIAWIYFIGLIIWFLPKSYRELRRKR
jgi:hypothetical protein